VKTHISRRSRPVPKAQVADGCAEQLGSLNGSCPAALAAKPWRRGVGATAPAAKCGDGIGATALVVKQRTDASRSARPPERRGSGSQIVEARWPAEQAKWSGQV
jgi:hypothetical protein